MKYKINHRGAPEVNPGTFLKKIVGKNFKVLDAYCEG